MKIKTLLLLSLSLAVVLGMPPFAPGVAQNSVPAEDDPNLDLQEKLQSQSMVELEIKVKPGVRAVQEGGAQQAVVVEPEVKAEPEIKVEPEVKAEPEDKVEPEVKAEPEIKGEPEIKAEPEDKVEPEVKAEPEIKVEPEAKAEPEDKVEPEVKAEPEIKVEPEVKAEPEDKVEPEVKAEPEDKVEPEVKAEPEIKEEPEVKAEPEIKEESEVKVEAEVKMEADIKVEPEVKAEPEIKVEPEVKAEPEDKVEPEVKAEPEDKVEPEVKAEPEIKEEPEVKAEPEIKEESEVKVEAEVKMEADIKVEPEVKAEPEVKVEPDLKAEPEIKVEVKAEDKVEPEVKVKPEVKVPMFNEEQEAQGQKFDERHVDMEPIMELEPLDEYNMFGDEPSDTELSEMEKSVRAAFQNKDPVIQPLSEEEELMKERAYDLDEEPIMELEPLDEGNVFGDEPSHTALLEVEKNVRAALQDKDPAIQPQPDEELMKEKPYVLDEEPIMELEPETRQQQVVSDVAIMDEGPALDSNGQKILPLEEYFPNEEARNGMKQGTLRVEGSKYIEEPEKDFAGEEYLSPVFGTLPFEEPAMEDSPVPDGSVQSGVLPKRESRGLMSQGAQTPVETSIQDRQATRQGYCPGVVLEGKCYQFFKEPKTAADAEFFCQDHFPGGHLASITSQTIHREMMSMMLQHNGAYTRTWIGGLRYLETGRFIWLDGSHWGYADWLPGEPNNTAGVEACLEVLAIGNGKFNDFTCWEPQAFICSYPFH